VGSPECREALALIGPSLRRAEAERVDRICYIEHVGRVELTDLARRHASALTQTEDTGIGASFSKIALAEVVYVKGRQSLLWALM
jgi:hypothetical protein